jgi:predicted nucleotidyltransferase
MSEIQERIESFVKQMSAGFGSRLKCIVLTGSHARGDALPSSDIDTWVFLDDVHQADLSAIGQIVQQLGPGPEVNPQCTSFTEVRSGTFRDQFSPIQLHMDGLIIHGELDLPQPSPKDLLRQAGAIAAFVMMSARHYVTVRETEERLARGKLQKWVLKPLMWALRYEASWREDLYPRTLPDLSKAAFSPEAVRLVGVYQQLLENRFSGPWMREVEQAESVAREIIEITERTQQSGTLDGHSAAK